MNYLVSKFILPVKSFLSEGHERSINAKKNILNSLIIKGLSIFISLFGVPLTIHYINPTQYGVWITLSSIIAWFGFFDIGFGNGLRNKLAESMAKGENKLARIYVSTTYAILAIIICIVLLLFFIVNPFLNWSKILNTPPEMAGELSLLALIVFVFFCMQFVLQLITTILNANQQSAKASLFSFLGSLFSIIIIFILTKTTSGNLLYLGFVFGATPVLVFLSSSIWFYSHQYKKYAPSIKFVKFRYARDLMTLGLKFFLIQIAVIILYQTSNIIIAQLYGPAQVTTYNIAYKYFSVIPMGFGIIMMPFWSAYTEAWVKKDIDWIRNSIKKLINIWIIICIVSVIMLIFSNFIYRIWVGKEIVVPISISSVIALYVVLNAWCGIFSLFLNGVGKIKLQLYSALFGAIVNIPLAIFLGKHFGVAGVVFSTCLLALTSAVWSPIQYYKIINNTAKGIWDK
ncbi:MAG: lipopolysaccharide biosynthesis protein [Bacteroidales bacterium]